ncbi:hypothetical protein Syun_030081 [Stephania yunnanensis]|uniref:Uncharacterized protein n=1 Tax=Stephania yunnanensis TaxID=152371 RepID=A0AAP0HK59_9MAGN
MVWSALSPRSARLTAAAPPPFILLTPRLIATAESITIVVTFHHANRCCVHHRLAPLPRTAASHRIVLQSPAFTASTVANLPLLRPPPPPTSPASTVADSPSRFEGDQHPSSSPPTTTCST